jgi:hypothetical protein
LVGHRIRNAVRLVITWFRPWIHTPTDGRGPRDVYLNGKKLDKVFYADIRHGMVRCHFDPMKVNKRRQMVRGFKRYGNVEVVRIGEM